MGFEHTTDMHTSKRIRHLADLIESIDRADERRLRKERINAHNIGYMWLPGVHQHMGTLQRAVMVVLYGLLLQTQAYRCQSAALARTDPDWHEADWAESETDVHVQPDLGILVSSLSRQSLPGNLLSLIYEIEEITRESMVIYGDPCDMFITRYLNQDAPTGTELEEAVAANTTNIGDKISAYKEVRRSQYSATTMRRRLANSCAKFGDIRDMYRSLQDTLLLHNDALREINRLLTHVRERNSTRSRRGIASWLRRSFNVGSYDEQVKLGRAVTLAKQKEDFLYGKLQDMTMIVKQQNNNTMQLTEAFNERGKLIRNLTEAVSIAMWYHNTAQRDREMKFVINQKELEWTRQAITAGTMYTQLLSLQAQLLTQRYEGLHELTRRRLSPHMVAPGVLQSSLVLFQRELQRLYPQFRLKTTKPLYYYLHARVIGYAAGDKLYIELPVSVFARAAVFQIYHLETHDIPVTANASILQYTKIIGFDDYIAVSIDRLSYILLTDLEYLNDCREPEATRCLSHKIIRPATQRSCSLAVWRCDADQIKELCQIRYSIHREPPRSWVAYLGNGKYFLQNYGKLAYYLQCREGSIQSIPRDIQLYIQLRCDCKLLGENGDTTARYLDRECSEVLMVAVKSNTFNNIVYLSYKLNATVSEIQARLAVTNPVMPEDLALALPDYSEHAGLKEIESFDLAKVIDALDNGETPFAHHFGDEIHGLISDRATHRLRQIWVWVVSGLTVGGMAGVAVLFLKNNALSKVLGVLSVTKGGQAAIVSMEVNKNLATIAASLSLELVLYAQVIVLSMVMLYWLCGNAYGLRDTILALWFVGRIHRQLPKTKSTVLLEIGTTSHNVIFTVMEIVATPQNIKVTGSLTPDRLEVVDYCLHSELRIKWSNVTVSMIKATAHPSWPEEIPCQLPARLKVYGIDARLLRVILAQTWEANLLMGSEGRYTRTPLTMQTLRVDAVTTRPQSLARHSMIDYESEFNDEDYDGSHYSGSRVDDFTLPPYPNSFTA